MKLGMTGIKGFIGSSVAQALQDEKHEVISLDPYTYSRKTDKNIILGKNCPNDLDWVLHFGATTSITASFENPFFTYSNNVSSTLSALKIANQSNAAIIFMSSYVYGNPQYLPIDEKHPVTSVNAYMGSKVVGEEICKQLSEQLHIPVVILRGFNVYGDHQNPGRLISDLLEIVRSGTEIAINDPNPRRDYLYIKDFCSLILKIISCSPVKVGTYNVGHGVSYTNIEVAEIIRRIAGERRPVVVKFNMRQNDISDCTVDVSLVKKAFSWSPSYTLEQGLSEIICRLW